MSNIEKTKKRNLIFKGRIISFYNDEVELPNGETATREHVTHPGGAAILAINEKNEVCLVEQFRYPYQASLLEIPAGKLEANEDPIKAAYRELEEETGYKCESMIHLGNIYPSVGYTNEIIHIYFAKGLIPSKQHLDDDEFLNLRKIPLDEFIQLVESNSIKDAKTVAALHYYLTKKDTVK